MSGELLIFGVPLNFKYMYKRLSPEEVALKDKMVIELSKVQKREEFLKKEIRKLIYKIEA